MNGIRKQRVAPPMEGLTDECRTVAQKAVAPAPGPYLIREGTTPAHFTGRGLPPNISSSFPSQKSGSISDNLSKMGQNNQNIFLYLHLSPALPLGAFRDRNTTTSPGGSHWNPSAPLAWEYRALESSLHFTPALSSLICGPLFASRIEDV